MRISFFLALLIVISHSANAKLYKWVDEEGNVQYSDKLPPAAVKKPHEKLDRHGLVIDRKGRAKTPEEIAEEERVKRLREETQRQIAEQQAKDRVLLNSYRSDDDIILARDGKLATIDSQIRITYTNITRLKERLSGYKQKAANLERQGKAISAQLQTSIDNTRKEINDSYASILRQEKDKDTIRSKYAQDLERFRTLSKLKADNRAQILAETERKNDDAIVKTVVHCQDLAHCNNLWNKAKTYAKKYATTPVYVDSDKIFITQPPRKNEDLSITVSRLRPRKDQAELIFLDIQCKKEVATDTWCKRPEAIKIRENFRTAILGKK
ncbi:DUF4124 domain-containing protein [Thiolapillus sp.]